MSVFLSPVLVLKSSRHTYVKINSNMIEVCRDQGMGRSSGKKHPSIEAFLTHIEITLMA